MAEGESQLQGKYERRHGCRSVEQVRKCHSHARRRLATVAGVSHPEVTCPFQNEQSLSDTISFKVLVVNWSHTKLKKIICMITRYGYMLAHSSTSMYADKQYIWPAFPHKAPGLTPQGNALLSLFNLGCQITRLHSTPSLFDTGDDAALCLRQSINFLETVGKKERKIIKRSVYSSACI